MPFFVYTGYVAGAAVSGELDGADANAIASLLQSRGVTPLDIHLRDNALVGQLSQAIALPQWLAQR